MADSGKHFKPKSTAPQQRVQSNAPQRMRPQTQVPAAQSRQRAVAPRPAHAGAAHARPAAKSSATASPYARDRKPQRRKRNIFPYVLIGIGVALLLFAAGLFIRAQLGYKQAADFYDGLEQQAVKDTDGKGIPEIDFDALRAVSEDIVGWIYIPNTRINYVVAQGETNNTYLRHLPSGEYNENGTVFMDAEQTAPGVVEQQTTLYGHHMNKCSMIEIINQTPHHHVVHTDKEDK